MFQPNDDSLRNFNLKLNLNITEMPAQVGEAGSCLRNEGTTAEHTTLGLRPKKSPSGYLTGFIISCGGLN
jgi:hypothetical protein